jgi:hypothetical protein
MEKDKETKQPSEETRKMTQQEEQAFMLINNVCYGYKGNFEDHTRIQQALNVIRNSLLR